MSFIQSLFDSNPWDWFVIIILLVLAIALGVKDGDEPAVPKELTVYAIGVFTLILVVFNLGDIIGFFTG